MSNRDLVLGMMIGAGAMYLMDPDRGRRRRALVRDQMVHSGHRLEDRANARARDLGNRARGMMAEAASRARPDDADDVVLRERVRSAIGRAAQNSSYIDVTVMDGDVTLEGPVPSTEVQAIVRAARNVRGVGHVTNRLEVYDESEEGSALQETGSAAE